MRLIKLSQGKSTKVDDKNYDWLSTWIWTYDSSNGYAYRRDYKAKKKIYMHRLILDTPKNFETDHINRDKLDNRRSNLRVVDRVQNSFNHGIHKNNTSGVKGVSWFKPAEAWRAYIGGSPNRRVELGYFKNFEDAVLARKKAEVEYGI